MIADSSDKWQPKQHLTDIDIAKILGLVKAIILQWEIVALMKYSQKAIQYTLATYLFETFQGHNIWQEYKKKTTEYNNHYIERTLKQYTSTPLRDITNIIRLPILEYTIHC